MRKLEKALRMGPKKVARILAHRAASSVHDKALSARDRLFPTERTYAESELPMLPIAIDTGSLDLSGLDESVCRELWRMYGRHRFDLLGSGWVQWEYGCAPSSFEGIQYEDEAAFDGSESRGELLRRTLRRSSLARSAKVCEDISKGYRLIDWQRDFRSGYRWDAGSWYKQDARAPKQGADIKLPWELSRLQHLPRLVLLSIKLPAEREHIVREYCDQVLDFIAQNPIRMGVNHKCTMDVGIRAANLALSYSLLRGTDSSLGAGFEKTLCNYLLNMCGHIFGNLENLGSYRSNHYFSNLTGILYGAAVLPDCGRKRRWLSFARDEIEKEIYGQFYEEGSNCEGSVGYHRLTAELALYSVMLVGRLAAKGTVRAYPREIYDRICRMCRFLEDVTRPDGQFPAIGDNDSGQLFRFSFTGRLITPEEAIRRYGNLSSYVPQADDKQYYDENVNDGRTLLSAGEGFFGARLGRNAAGYPLEYSLAAQFSVPNALGCSAAPPPAAAKERKAHDIPELPYRASHVIPLKTSVDMERLSLTAYAAFGVYIYRSEGFYLCICMTDNGQGGNAGHAHNDKLSFELMSGGEILFEDPGTYTYTADGALRDLYRGTRTHNTIWAGEEQNTFRTMFSMEDNTRCAVLHSDKTSFTGEVRFRGVHCVREFRIERDRLVINDCCNRPFESNFSVELHTSGYGKRLNASNQ